MQSGLYPDIFRRRGSAWPKGRASDLHRTHCTCKVPQISSSLPRGCRPRQDSEAEDSPPIAESLAPKTVSWMLVSLMLHAFSAKEELVVCNPRGSKAKGRSLDHFVVVSNALSRLHLSPSLNWLDVVACGVTYLPASTIHRR